MPEPLPSSSFRRRSMMKRFDGRYTRTAGDMTDLPTLDSISRQDINPTAPDSHCAVHHAEEPRHSDELATLPTASSRRPSSPSTTVSLGFRTDEYLDDDETTRVAMGMPPLRRVTGQQVRALETTASARASIKSSSTGDTLDLSDHRSSIGSAVEQRQNTQRPYSAPEIASPSMLDAGAPQSTYDIPPTPARRNNDQKTVICPVCIHHFHQSPATILIDDDCCLICEEPVPLLSRRSVSCDENHLVCRSCVATTASKLASTPHLLPVRSHDWHPPTCRGAYRCFRCGEAFAQNAVVYVTAECRATFGQCCVGSQTAIRCPFHFSLGEQMLHDMGKASTALPRVTNVCVNVTCAPHLTGVENQDATPLEDPHADAMREVPRKERGRLREVLRRGLGRCKAVLGRKSSGDSDGAAAAAAPAAPEDGRSEWV
ncbi:hypothetical protein P153DRAFT_391411 [Dothidotthia symphoricarpi CBS 119687]|uniref:Uncharacterized protein n=1 Tax=Dothidotthia symphoricarpi CBS 119687 TaxID=1392245 RepID=A0A6A5ZXD4_9PLEO|nr:uncharacterized protein P153DRAFT_391411 [Dothidotthia symphoricarpi CBS 119687]KAF2123574.1 hypothetical protein P153DRAFT_391411 [Dothidotthia symphoricarpi CBS 119687]